MICISHLRWDSLQKRTKQNVSRMADQHRVLYLEEPLCSLSALRPYLEIFREDHHGVHDLTVLRLVYPVGTKRAIGHNNPHAQPIYARLVQKFLQFEHYNDPIIWLCTPSGLPLANAIEHKHLIYDVMEQPSVFDATSGTTTYEQQALRKVD